MKKTCSLPVLLLALVLLTPVPALASAEDTVSAPERPEAVRLALAAGIGHAYDLLGVHLELRSSHWALFAGTGLPVLQGPSGVVGFKVFSRPGAGLVGSLHLSGSRFDGPTSLPLMVSLSATVGWRFRWSDAFLELGIGQSFSYAQLVFNDDATQGAAVVDHVFGFGALGPDPTGPAFFPDVALAVGYEF